VCPPSRPLFSFPDLCYVDATPGAVEGAGAANDVSGEQLMGDRPADTASPPPGELCRIAIVTRDPLSFLLVFFLTLTLTLALLILSELSRVRASRRVRVALIPCPSPPCACPLPHHLAKRFVSVTLVLAGDVDTAEETVDELLRLFGVCVLFVVSRFRVAPFVNWSVCVVLFFSDRLFVLNIGVCTTIIRVRFRNV
jgi:hypothetical protein